MNESLIKFTGKNENNIYNVRYIEGNFNIVQKYKAYFTKTDGNVYTIKISHNKLEGLNNLNLVLTIPDIKGKGKINFNKYFGFGLIDDFQIIINKNSIITVTGKELLYNYLQYCNKNCESQYETLMGNNEDFLLYKQGKGKDFIIFNKTQIEIPLILFFDKDSPINILRTPPSSDIIFNLKLNNIQNVVNYDHKYLENGLDPNIIESNLDPILYIDEYNTCNSEISHKYFNQSEETIYEPNSNEHYSSPSFKSITDISFYVQTPIFSNGSSFVAYPDKIKGKESFIKAYEQEILKEIIIITDDPEETIKQHPGAKLIKVEKNKKIKFNKNDSCEINILNITNETVYYHGNILTFSRRHSDKIFNISEKFRYIEGIYFPESKKIKFTDVVSDLTISDVSIPSHLWKSEYNTALGDLRKNKNDIIVNNPFIEGMDFLGFDNKIESVTINAGNNTLFNLCNFNFNHRSSTLKHYYPTRYTCNFNSNVYFFIKPSRLISDSSSNFNNCDAIIKTKKYDDIDIRSLIPFYIKIIVNHCKKLVYENNEVKVISY